MPLDIVYGATQMGLCAFKLSAQEVGDRRERVQRMKTHGARGRRLRPAKCAIVHVDRIVVRARRARLTRSRHVPLSTQDSVQLRVGKRSVRADPNVNSLGGLPFGDVAEQL